MEHCSYKTTWQPIGLLLLCHTLQITFCTVELSWGFATGSKCYFTFKLYSSAGLLCPTGEKITAIKALYMQWFKAWMMLMCGFKCHKSKNTLKLTGGDNQGNHGAGTQFGRRRTSSNNRGGKNTRIQNQHNQITINTIYQNSKTKQNAKHTDQTFRSRRWAQIQFSLPPTNRNFSQRLSNRGSHYGLLC